MDATLATTGWTGDTPTQTLSVPGLPANSPAWIGLAVTATAAQRDAARKAALSPTARAAGSVTITADGAQPTTDLPVTVYYVKKASAGGTAMLASIINMFPGGSTLQIPLDAPSALTAKAGNAQVSLTWTDPNDKYATPEGETAQDPDQLVSKWSYTRIVRKVGSQPSGPNDGTTVLESAVRNQYQTEPFVDTGLQNEVTYYYGAFAYNEDGVVSEGVFGSAMPMAGTFLGDLAEGTLITINEDGAPVQFNVACQNYESELNGAGRVLVLRKDIYNTQPWDSDNSNAWTSSSLRSWLNGTYKRKFSSNVQSLMSTTQYYFTSGYTTWVVKTRSDAIFLVSYIEIGLPVGISFNTEGTKFPVADSIRISSLDGVATSYWTRSAEIDSYNAVGIVSSTGTPSGYFVKYSYGVRPCFSLPATAMVDTNNALIETA